MVVPHVSSPFLLSTVATVATIAIAIAIVAVTTVATSAIVPTIATVYYPQDLDRNCFPSIVLLHHVVQLHNHAQSSLCAQSGGAMQLLVQLLS